MAIERLSLVGVRVRDAATGRWRSPASLPHRFLTHDAIVDGAMREGGLIAQPSLDVAAEAQRKVEELKQGLLALARPEAELPDEELRWFRRLLSEIKEISPPAFDKAQAILRHPLVATVILEAILRSV